MHRVLEPLHELLEMGNSRLERPNLVLFSIDARRRPGLLSFCAVANLTDSCDQSFGRSHSSPPARTLGRCRALRIAPTLFRCHLADHQRTALDLLANQLELGLALLLGSLPSAFHLVTSRGRTTDSIDGADSRPGLRAPANRHGRPTALTT